MVADVGELGRKGKYSQLEVTWLSKRQHGNHKIPIKGCETGCIDRMPMGLHPQKQLAHWAVDVHSHKILTKQQGKPCDLGIWCNPCSDQERCQAGRAS